MNKTKRRVFTAIISCFLALTMVFSVACGGDDDSPAVVSNPYTVTVTYAADNSPVTSSSIQVVFTATPGAATASYALGADGTVSVPYETLNTAITTDTKTVTLTGVNSNYEVVSGTYTVSSSSRTVSISLVEKSYTVSVLGTDGNAYTSSTGVNVVFYDADTDATYTTPLTASGSVTVGFNTLSGDDVTSSTVYARLTGVDSEFYSGLTTLSNEVRTGTINITTKTAIHNLYDEYATVYPDKTQSIENWLLKIINGSILPSNNQATAVSLTGSTVNVTASTPVTYTVSVDNNNLVITGTETYTIGKYTAEVKDQNDDPVEDVYLRLTYVTPAPDFEQITVFNSYSTSNGSVIFYALTNNSSPYRVQTQDFSREDPDRPSTITNPLPAGYSTPTGTYGIVQYATGATNVEYKLDYYPSNFNTAISKYNHNYARYIFGTAENGEFGAGAKLNQVAERNTDLTVNVEANVYSYVSFSPYVEPGAGDVTGLDSDVAPSNPIRPEQQAQIAARKAAADEASAGKYKITLVTNDQTATRLTYFASTTAKDSDGIPTDVAKITGEGSGELYTGQDYIELELRVYHNENRNVYWFAVVSSIDCTATIRIERTGEAVEPAAAQVHTVTPEETLTQYTVPGATSSTRPNDMPIDGNYTAVLGEDDYYHVNSATGPLLYVQLTKNMTRLYGDGTTLQTLPTVNEFGNKCYQFSVYKDAQNPDLVTDIYDYVQFVADYCQVADTSTGLYPVNAEIKTFLEYLASTSAGTCVNTAADGFEWLSYCQYVGEVLAPGSGTQERPYTLVLGNSNVTIGATGTTYTRVTLNSGVYRLAAVTNLGAALATPSFRYDGDLAQFTSDNYLILTVQEDNTEVVLTLNGAQGNYRVSVNAVATVEEAHIIDSQNTTNLGISEATAIAINNAPGVYAIHSLSDQLQLTSEYTYFKLSAAPARAGTYELIVNGTGTLVYNGQEYKDGEICEVTLTVASADTPITIKIKSEDGEGLVDSYVMLIARRVTAS